MKDEDKPIVRQEKNVGGTSDIPNPILTKLFDTIKKIADAHNLGVFLYVAVPTGEITIGEDGKTRRGNESAMMVHQMNEQTGYVLGKTISNVPQLADAVAAGWKDSVAGRPVNQNEAAVPTVQHDPSSTPTIH